MYSVVFISECPSAVDIKSQMGWMDTGGKIIEAGISICTVITLLIVGANDPEIL